MSPVSPGTLSGHSGIGCGASAKARAAEQASNSRTMARLKCLMGGRDSTGAVRACIQFVTSRSGCMAYGGDADWEMFCRGRGDDSAEPFGMPGGGSGDVSVGGPVALEPADDDDGAAERPGAAVRHFFARVVGLPYANSDGTSRREAVRGLRRWDRVRLVHRPD